MKKIVFICHGNICRSPAAEYIMKKLLLDNHLENKFEVISRATSLEEIGNDIYPPMKRALRNIDIEFGIHSAKRITIEEYNNADYVYYMDNNNLNYLKRLLPNIDKCESITKYSPSISYIDDPWYTGYFEEVVNQIKECCESILSNIKR